MPTGHRPTSVDAVLAQLRADPGRPRLTWYGPSGERVELSGHVLDNWVSKIANLLVEELDAGPGTVVALDLPTHWRTVTWALAAWRVGACVALGRTATPAAAVVTATPERHPDARDVVAVALPALSRSFDGTLPPGAVDAASGVMTYGDVLVWAPPTDPAQPAVELGAEGPGVGAGTTTVTHGELVAWATAGAQRVTGPEGATGSAGSGLPARVLVESDGTGSAADDLRTVLGVLAADGSVVLCAPEVTRELAADPGRRERLRATERVTVDARDGA
ncbi:TIGR03089 family protein [Actinotalea ferrariae]|uniref:TIGR03089 family protein n=1 Tax=Actinotalea ferrariae TaxID=1386098 RepID=UPI001C8B533B|nr:TIGR03089 family protein [Actinotalea ferrariae]MBX9243456.1 TIGR03089 family protein [Actinotalea ferrariae]